MASGADLIARLQGICGTEHVLTHPHALATYRSDGLTHYQQTPLAAVLPATARRSTRSSGRASRPASRGSRAAPGTGPLRRRAAGRRRRADRARAAAADPRRSSSRTPGSSSSRASRNLAISRAVAPTHFYPPDPSSQIVCSIGGNVAENSGGAHCFKYGFTTNYVTGLEVVLSDGDRGRARPRRPRLRPARRVRRLRGDARRRHADRAAGDARARVGPHARRVLRGHGRRRATPSPRSSTPGSCPARSR